MKFRKVVVGGTFDYFHDGHAALLSKAFEVGEEVELGICSDEMQELLMKDSAGIQPLSMRMWMVLDFLKQKGWLPRAKLAVLFDPFGPAASDRGAEAIVVSPETRPKAEELNRLRASKGLPQLSVVEVPFVPSEDGRPISSIRIRYGEMDQRGKILKTSHVQ
ncbi:MAG: pantetheine-phosphate adenylyltransferase [Candidatus Hadarchaeota archaeon]